MQTQNYAFCCASSSCDRIAFKAQPSLLVSESSKSDVNWLQLVLMKTWGDTQFWGVGGESREIISRWCVKTQQSLNGNMSVYDTPGKKVSLFPSIHSSLSPVSHSTTSGCTCRKEKARSCEQAKKNPITLSCINDGSECKEKKNFDICA